MRKIIIVFVLFLYGINLYAIMGVVDSVIIVGDSPATMRERLAASRDRLRSYMKAVEQVMLTATVIQNQINAVQSLAAGDFQAFADFFYYQTEAINNFSDLMGNFDYFTQFQEMGEGFDTPGFNDFQEGAQEIAQSWTMANNLVQNINGLVQRSKSRIQKMQALNRLSEGEDSPVAQLQIFNEEMALVHGTLEDLVKIDTAAINLAEYHEERRLAERELGKAVASDFFREIDERDSEYPLKHEISEKELHDYGWAEDGSLGYRY